MALQKIGVRAEVEGYAAYIQNLKNIDAQTAKVSGSLSSQAATTKKTTSAFAGLGQQVGAMAGGFIAAQVGVAGVQKAFSSTIGAAVGFEAQLARIQALTGVAAEDMDFLEKSIKDMARVLPQSPEELGAGAYFILSSGISDAADATKVLEIAAKASTIGLGQTAVVADALTTVIKAYQLTADDAGQVTDILIQAVKDGKAEADAFAGVLGRVVPIASQMGIGFEEVAANLATFTRLGVSAEEAATGLRGVLTQLLRPSDQARELLAQYGLTIDEVRKSVRERGLAASLQDLIKLFGGNEEAISTLFPDVRGLVDVLATAGVQGEAYTQILDNMNNATGGLDKGFEQVSQTTEFKFKKAMGNLNVSLLEIGETTLPLVNAAISGLADIANTVDGVVKILKGDFDELNASMAESAIKIVTFIGPFQDFREGLLSISRGDVLGGLEQLALDVSGVGSAIDLGGKATDAAGDIFSSVFGGGGPVAKSVITASGAADEIERLKNWEEDAARTAKGEFSQGLLDAADNLEVLRTKAETTRTALFNMFKEPTKEEVQAEAALAALNLETARITSSMDPATAATEELASKLKEQGVEAATAEAISRGLTAAEAERFSLLKTDLIPEQEDSLAVTRLTREALGAQTEATYGQAQSLSDLQTATESQSQQLDILNLKTGDTSKTTDGFRKNVQTLFDVVNDTSQAFSGGLGPLDEWIRKVREGQVAVHDLAFETQIATLRTNLLSAIASGNIAQQRLISNVLLPQVLAGEFQHGTMRVPETMPALVHKDEMILPAGLADVVRDAISAPVAVTAPPVIVHTAADTSISVTTQGGGTDALGRTLRSLAFELARP